MANPDYAAGAFFKTEQPSRLEVKADRKAKAAANLRAVSQQVDKRDNYRCRACGSSCNPEAIDLLEKGHRHHLEYRSKGGQDVASNLLTLCARCHDAEHRHVLRVDPQTPYGADGPVEVWRFRQDVGWYLTRRESAIHRVERD